MMTDFIDVETGERTHINDGKDQVIAATGADVTRLQGKIAKDRAAYGEDLAQFEQNSQTNLRMTVAELNDIAGVVYAETSKNGVDWREPAGIYGVLNNRAAANGSTVQTEANATGIYGAAHKNDAFSQTASKAKLNAVYKGIALSRVLNRDFSNGAFYWQGVDFSRHFKGMHAHESFYKVGFQFTSPSHDVFKMGDHKSGNAKWDFKYESTAGAGKTVFIKLTQAWQKANGSTKWNGR